MTNSEDPPQIDRELLRERMSDPEKLNTVLEQAQQDLLMRNELSMMTAKPLLSNVFEAASAGDIPGLADGLKAYQAAVYESGFSAGAVSVIQLIRDGTVTGGLGSTIAHILNS